MTTAIVLWNTAYRECATDTLRVHGHLMDDALLRYRSAGGWEHINLTGDFLWHNNAEVSTGKFGPLRPLTKP